MNRANCQKCSKCHLCVKICKCFHNNQKNQECLKITVQYCGISIVCLDQKTAAAIKCDPYDRYILETGDFKKGCCKLWKVENGELTWITPSENPFYFYDQIANKMFKVLDSTCSLILGKSGDKIVDLPTGTLYEYGKGGWEIIGKFGSGTMTRANVPCTLRWVDPTSLQTPGLPGKIINTDNVTESSGEWFMNLEKSGNHVTASVYPSVSEISGVGANDFKNPGPESAVLFISPSYEDLSEFFPEKINQVYSFSVVGKKTVEEPTEEKFQQAVVVPKQLQEFNDHKNIIGNSYGGFYVYNTKVINNQPVIGQDSILEGGSTVTIIDTTFDASTFYSLNPFSYSWTLCPELTPGFMASFTATPTSGANPLTVQFTDTSKTEKGTIKAWEWNFGDGSTGSNEQNPVHTYTKVGSFTVTLTVTNSLNETNSRTLPNLITVNQGLTAKFHAVPNTGVVGTTINFRDASTEGNSAINSWVWDFGDGSVPSVEQNPEHTYGQTGFFTVKLEVRDIDGNVDVACEENFIIIYGANEETFSIFYIPEVGNTEFPFDFGLSWFDGGETAGTAPYCFTSIIPANVIRSTNLPILQTNKNGDPAFDTSPSVPESNVLRWIFPKSSMFQTFDLNETVYAFGFRLGSKSTGVQYTQDVYIDTLDIDLDSLTIRRTISRDIGTSDLDCHWKYVPTFSGELSSRQTEVIFLTADNSTVCSYNANGTYNVNNDNFGITFIETGSTTSVNGVLQNETMASGTFTLSSIEEGNRQGIFSMEKFLPSGTMNLATGSLNLINLAGVSSDTAVGLRYFDTTGTVLQSVSASIYAKDLFYKMKFGATGLAEGTFGEMGSPIPFSLTLTAQSQNNPPDDASVNVIAGVIKINQFDENGFNAQFEDLVVEIDPINPVEFFAPVTGNFNVSFF